MYSDTRPIGFVEFQHLFRANPNFTTPDVLKMADTMIALGKKYNWQGFMVWDQSGDDYLFPDPDAPGKFITKPEIRYIGDPRIHHGKLNLSTLDQFYRKLTGAGFKIGCLVRHGDIVKDVAGYPNREEPESIVTDVMDKIGYFRSRYGKKACLFYVDSNERDGFTIDMRQMINLRTYFPVDEVMIAFEHTNPPPGAPWYEVDVRASFHGWCNGAADMVPNPLGPDLIGPWPVESLTDANRAMLKAKLADGSIPMVYGWTDATINGLMASAMNPTLTPSTPHP